MSWCLLAADAASGPDAAKIIRDGLRLVRHEVSTQVPREQTPLRAAEPGRAAPRAPVVAGPPRLDDVDGIRGLVRPLAARGPPRAPGRGGARARPAADDVRRRFRGRTFEESQEGLHDRRLPPRVRHAAGSGLQSPHAGARVDDCHRSRHASASWEFEKRVGAAKYREAKEAARPHQGGHRL